MNSRPKRSTFRSRYDEMLETLRGEILNMVWKKNSYLPSENELAERFELSKNSIRKGLDVLVEEGFVEKVPRVGNRICYHATTIQLKMAHYPSLESEACLHEIVELFHKENPSIHINLMRLPNGAHNSYMKDNMLTDQFDLISINNQNYELFIESSGKPEVLEPLEVNNGVYSLLNKPFLHENELYVQPLIFSPVILCYNKDHFMESNIPEPDSSWTWEDITQVASDIKTSTNRFGFFFHLLSDNRWPIFLMQHNVSFPNDAQLDQLDPETDEKLLKSFSLINNLKNTLLPQFLSEDDHDAEQLFRQQKVSMILATYFSLNMLKDVDFAYDISPVPYVDSPKSLLLVIGLAINKYSEHKEAAKAFMDFMLKHETQLIIRKHTTSIPSLKSAAEWKGEINVTQPDRYSAYREIFPTYSYYTELNVEYEQLVAIKQRLKLYLSDMH